MADLHIDDFYRDAALALCRLYSVFPRKCTLYTEDICGPDSPDEFGLHSPRYEACFSTLLWLAQHDYLHYSDAIQQQGLDQAVLSHKAFLLLSSPLPESDAAAGSAVRELRRTLQSGTSTQLSGLMRRVLMASRDYR